MLAAASNRKLRMSLDIFPLNDSRTQNDVTHTVTQSDLQNVTYSLWDTILAPDFDPLWDAKYLTLGAISMNELSKGSQQLDNV